MSSLGSSTGVQAQHNPALDQIQKQVTEIQDIQARNIQKLIENVEALEVLSDKINPQVVEKRKTSSNKAPSRWNGRDVILLAIAILGLGLLISGIVFRILEGHPSALSTGLMASGSSILGLDFIIFLCLRCKANNH